MNVFTDLSAGTPHILSDSLKPTYKEDLFRSKAYDRTPRIYTIFLRQAGLTSGAGDQSMHIRRRLVKKYL